MARHTESHHFRVQLRLYPSRPPAEAPVPLPDCLAPLPLLPLPKRSLVPNLVARSLAAELLLALLLLAAPAAVPLPWPAVLLVALLLPSAPAALDAVAGVR